MKHVNYYLISFILLIFFPLTSLSNETGESSNTTEFLEMDFLAFNESVLSENLTNYKWKMDPVIVSLKFIGLFEGKKQIIERINESAESLDKTLILITNEGLLDDSVMGIKYKIVLKKAGDVWLIQNAGKAVKCWPGRGHSNYSPEPCN